MQVITFAATEQTATEYTENGIIQCVRCTVPTEEITEVASKESTIPRKTGKTWAERFQSLNENYRYIIQNRNGYICDFVVLLTQKKVHRDEVDSYQLKKVGKNYQLFYMGQPMFKPCDAKEAYSWLVRLPLRKFQMWAESHRMDVAGKHPEAHRVATKLA